MSRHKPTTRERVFDDVTLIANSSDHDAVVRRIPIVDTAWLVPSENPTPPGQGAS